MSERIDEIGSAFELRDDNLRLLFSEAAKRELGERLRAIGLGVPVLAACVLLALTGWVVRLVSIEPAAGVPLIELLIRFDSTTEFVVSAMLIVGGAIALLSPVVYAMLLAERRKCRRELKSLAALLARYGRN